MTNPAQFVLETFPDGGILLDLGSGILFGINPTAAFVWERALAGASLDEIVRAFQSTFEVNESVARSDVQGSLVLPTMHDLPRLPTSFRYDPLVSGYRISEAGVPILEIDTLKQTLHSLPGLRTAEAGLYIRTFTPKFVALLGTSVLHASAVAGPSGDVIAFVGDSGAGKTTTARAFAEVGTGWRILCEDKLVLRQGPGGIVAALDGEAQIAKWMATARAKLATAVGASCDLSPLADVGDGPVLPVSRFFLIDCVQRRGATIDIKRLPQLEAAKGLFRHGFYGSAAPSEWRRQLHVAATLARTSPTYDAGMPEGLHALNEAARLYTETIAS